MAAKRTKATKTAEGEKVKAPELSQEDKRRAMLINSGRKLVKGGVRNATMFVFKDGYFLYFIGGPSAIGAGRFPGELRSQGRAASAWSCAACSALTNVL